MFHGLKRIENHENLLFEIFHMKTATTVNFLQYFKSYLKEFKLCLKICSDFSITTHYSGSYFLHASYFLCHNLVLVEYGL